MRPYYEHGNITIYHADCADILPEIDPIGVDLLLTDPPYGIGYVVDSGGRPAGSREGERVAGDDEPFDPSHLMTFPRAVIWGGNYFAHMLPPGGWIVWSKAQDNRWAYGKASTRSLAEVAWTNLHKYVGLYNCFWAGSPLYRHSERGANLHPTQKPVELMRWIVDRYTEPGDLIFDPYMGSGPVARACKDTGRHYIGVEIEERYCETAVERLAQEVLDFGDGAA